MEILVVDPAGTVAPVAETAFRERGWRTTVRTDRARAFSESHKAIPDAVVVLGDGRAGETTHFCQRFKQNPLTAGVPIVLVESGSPPAWLLAGMPADAFTQAPFDASELLHHLDMLLPPVGTGGFDDLTNCARRQSLVEELDRRLLARELFAAGLLSLLEAESYRQDFGRVGMDQFAVLVSVILRRHAGQSTPISIGYLDEGTFVVLGAPSAVHHVVAQTIRDFEALVPAYYEMDTLFGEQDAQSGPMSWVNLEGAVCLIEPGRFDNALQVGHTLATTLESGHDAVRPTVAAPAEREQVAMVAD